MWELCFLCCDGVWFRVVYKVFSSFILFLMPVYVDLEYDDFCPFVNCCLGVGG